MSGSSPCTAGQWFRPRTPFPNIWSASNLYLDPDRHMVGRLLPSARKAIDACGGDSVGGLRREQKVIDADAIVLLPGAGLIVPERVDAGVRIDGADGVREPESEQGPVGSPALRLEQGVVPPGVGITRVHRFGNNVVVAG